MKELSIAGRITFKDFKTAEGVAGWVLVYEQLMAVLRTPAPGRGANYQEMGDIVRIMGKMRDTAEKGGETILIEKGEHAVLMRCINQFSWPINDQALSEWLESIEKLPDIKIKKVEQNPDKKSG